MPFNLCQRRRDLQLPDGAERMPLVAVSYASAWTSPTVGLRLVAVSYA